MARRKKQPPASPISVYLRAFKKHYGDKALIVDEITDTTDEELMAYVGPLKMGLGESILAEINFGNRKPVFLRINGLRTGDVTPEEDEHGTSDPAYAKLALAALADVVACYHDWERNPPPAETGKLALMPPRKGKTS